MILEREEELALLSGLVARLGTSGGKVVLIRGEAGIGKSALLEAFLAAHAEGAAIITGTCDDLFIPQALGPFWDMARTEPALRDPLEHGDRPRLLSALVELMGRAGQPTLLVIEDTHWADEGTLDAIRHLGRRMSRANGLLLLTYRDGEVDTEHPLRRVVGDIPPDTIVRLQLGGLSLPAVTDLIAGSELDPREVFEATRGNPLLAREMAAGAEEGVTASLHDSLAARLVKLSVGAQELLKSLSVIPEPIARSDALRLAGANDERLDECERRGFLEGHDEHITFRHELIRRSVEGVMSESERLAKFRAVLAGLPEETHPCLLIHCAAEVNDIDRLVDLAPRSARYAAATGCHVQAAEDFREIGPHLDRFSPDELGPLLDEWAREEFLVDEIPAAIRINALAREHYRARGAKAAESRALAQAAHYHENAGQRALAEGLGREAVEILGDEPDGTDLARALEVNAYLAMMSGDVRAIPDLVERTLRAGGEDIDETVLIRSLNHRGIADNIAGYPAGRTSLDEAQARATRAEQWYEECRALFNHAWAAAESRDVSVASDYARRAIASAVRHELPGLESYARAMHARVLELEGAWDEAADAARQALDGAAITQMVALPTLGSIQARHGRPTAAEHVERAWAMAVATEEVQRTGPAAVAAAELAWLTGEPAVSLAELAAAMDAGLELGFRWTPGRIAAWLWEMELLDVAPKGIAEPYRLLIDGRATEAAAAWYGLGIPYERALALMHGDQAEQFEALETLETLGATAVAARLRRSMRAAGITVPRGRGRATRRHAAGLTARQAEVLELLGENLSNVAIADRLFVSPRTVENHVAAILDKLDAASRDEAVARARSEGLFAVGAAHT